MLHDTPDAPGNFLGFQTMEELDRAMIADRVLECVGWERRKGGKRAGIVVGGERIVVIERDLPNIVPKQVSVTDEFNAWLDLHRLSSRWWFGDTFPQRVFVEDINDEQMIELRLRFL